MSASMIDSPEYLQAFNARKAAGEINPEHRAKADVVTQRSIERKKKKAAAEAEANASTSGVKGADKKEVPTSGGDGSIASGALSGAATGASIGGPWGAVAGAALGGLGAASANKKKEYAAKKAGMSNALGTYLQLIDKGMV